MRVPLGQIRPVMKAMAGAAEGVVRKAEAAPADPHAEELKAKAAAKRECKNRKRRAVYSGRSR